MSTSIFFDGCSSEKSSYLCISLLPPPRCFCITPTALSAYLAVMIPRLLWFDLRQTKEIQQQQQQGKVKELHKKSSWKPRPFLCILLPDIFTLSCLFLSFRIISLLVVLIFCPADVLMQHCSPEISEHVFHPTSLYLLSLTFFFFFYFLDLFLLFFFFQMLSHIFAVSDIPDFYLHFWNHQKYSSVSSDTSMHGGAWVLSPFSFSIVLKGSWVPILALVF